METGTVALRRYEPGDEHRLVELYETCFGSPQAVDDWRWRYLEVPMPADLHVVTVDGRVMGFVGMLSFHAWMEGRRARLILGGDLMIDPEAQGQGLGAMLLSPKDMEWGDMHCGFPAASTLRAAAKAGRPIAVSGDVPQWVRWQSGAAVHADAGWIPKRVGAVAVGALRVSTTLQSRLRRRRRVIDVDAASFDQWAHAFDGLAEASREFAAVAPSADASGIDGFIVYGVQAGQGRIVDLLAVDATAMQSLLLTAIDRLSRDGVERILFELVDHRPWVARVLRRCGFLRRGRGPAITVFPFASWISGNLSDLRTWYLTFGDTDHD
jgi:GNAT superfamily N-acetyltransferase